MNFPILRLSSYNSVLIHCLLGTKMIIREAKRDESNWILHHHAEMNRSMGVEEERIKKSLEVSNPFFKQDWTQDFHYYLFEKDESIIGGCGLSVFRIIPFASNPTGLMAYLFNMFVEPAYRRQGVGSALMRHIYGICKKEGIHYIGLHASPMGQYLYESEGFFVSTSFMQLLPLEENKDTSD
jgi:GNAT superfamily N-acetyltransferase